MTWSGEAPPKTHNLGLLLGKVVPYHPALVPLQKKIRRLDKYYISARYPDNTFTEFKKEDADIALQTALELILMAQEIPTTASSKE